jgi:flagellar hook-associated protein 2
VTQSIDGLASNLDTTAILKQLMALERAPQDRLVARRTSIQNQISGYQSVNSKLAALASAAQSLRTAGGWNAWNATSSSPTRVTALVGPGAIGGSLSFAVDQLAQAHALISAGTVASTASVVATNDILLSQNTTAIGLSSAAAGSGLALGEHTIEVTQVSAAAEKTGASALAASTVITTGVNDVLEVTVHGVPETITIAADTYDRAGLAAAVQAASGGALTASVDGSNQLVLSTVREGTAATLQVTGGTALTDLHLTTDISALTGTDGVIDVDGTANTISDVTSGATVVLTSGTGGTVSGVLSGGIRSGTVVATNVSAGDGSLATVVSNINAANAGVSATAVGVSSTAYRLQLASTSTGVSSTLGIAPGAFAPLGALGTLTAAQDAQITVGSGQNSFSVTASTNAISNVLPGVTLALLAADSNVPVTVTVGRDATALANRVQGLVSAANSVVAEIHRLVSFDPSTSKSAALTGDFTVRRIADTIASALTGPVSGSLGSPGLVGLHVTRDGTFTFDQAKFVAAYQADPASVEELFRQGGTATSAEVAFYGATTATHAGTYAVELTAAAERAEAQGTVLGGGTITAAETIDLEVDSTNVTYAASAGESLISVALGLNAAIAEAGLGIVASVESNALVVRHSAYGSAAEFSVRTSTVAVGQTGIAAAANVWDAHAGVDVAGTINGVAATGMGQILASPLLDPDLGGLSLKITATPAEVALSGDFGTFTFVPGVAARLDAFADAAIDPLTGSLATRVIGRQSEVGVLDRQISAWDIRLALREQRLRAQYTAMETALARLQSQSTWLTGQLAQLRGTSTR